MAGDGKPKDPYTAPTRRVSTRSSGGPVWHALARSLADQLRDAREKQRLALESLPVPQSELGRTSRAAAAKRIAERIAETTALEGEALQLAVEFESWQSAGLSAETRAAVIERWYELQRKVHALLAETEK